MCQCGYVRMRAALATFSEDAEEMAAATLAEREEQQRKQALAASPQDEEVKRREQEEKEKEDKYKDLVRPARAVRCIVDFGSYAVLSCGD